MWTGTASCRAGPPYFDAREEKVMAESQLVLTAEERQFLTGLLEMAMKETRVEEHRTRTPNYRKFVLQQEHLIAALLGKLGKQAE